MISADVQRLYRCFRDRVCSTSKPVPTTKHRLVCNLYDKMYAERTRYLRFHFAAGAERRYGVYGLRHLERLTFKTKRSVVRSTALHARLRVDACATEKASWRNSRQLQTLHIMHERLAQFRRRNEMQ